MTTSDNDQHIEQQNEELEWVRAENAQLRRDMQDLREQVRQLCASRPPTVHQPPPPPNIDYNLLVNTFPSAMQQNQATASTALSSTNQPSHGGSASFPTLPATGAHLNLDMSIAHAPSDSILNDTALSTKRFEHERDD
ncbi:hypothetical protein ACA910_021986 [Epithemia clementina (nom. ined.)]